MFTQLSLPSVAVTCQVLMITMYTRIRDMRFTVPIIYKACLSNHGN
jgi:hypothetical protein